MQKKIDILEIANIKEYREDYLKEHNAEEFYKHLHETFNVDEDGIALYNTASKLTGIDVYEEFPKEDELGYFDNCTGYQLLEWIERAKFGGIKNEKDSNNQDYKSYKIKLYEEVVKYPVSIDFVRIQINVFNELANDMKETVDKKAISQDEYNHYRNTVKRIKNIAVKNELQPLLDKIEEKAVQLESVSKSISENDLTEDFEIEL